jgi:hypothetical protein
MFGGAAMAAAIAAPVSSASAYCYYGHCRYHDPYYYGGPVGGVFGLAGAVVAGAATIAAAPLVLAGGVVAGPAYGPVYDPVYGTAYYSYDDDAYYPVGYYAPHYYYRRYYRPYRYVYAY